jgi:hypothetical protein
MSVKCPKYVKMAVPVLIVMDRLTANVRPVLKDICAARTLTNVGIILVTTMVFVKTHLVHTCVIVKKVGTESIVKRI